MYDESSLIKKETTEAISSGFPTLPIGISFQVVFQRWDLVGAASGLWVTMTPEDSWTALQFHSSKVPYYYIFLVFFLISFFAVWVLSRSKLGYRLRAVRDDPQAALSLVE